LRNGANGGEKEAVARRRNRMFLMEGGMQLPDLERIPEESQGEKTWRFSIFSKGLALHKVGKKSVGLSAREGFEKRETCPPWASFPRYKITNAMHAGEQRNNRKRTCFDYLGLKNPVIEAALFTGNQGCDKGD